MHDTDMAGILFFGNQFRFVHEAWEDWLEEKKLGLQQLFTKESFVFVIVHAEADYLASMAVGDPLEIEVSVDNLGKSSFTIQYLIYRKKELVGRAKTVHVTLDRITRSKIPIPDKLRALLT